LKASLDLPFSVIKIPENQGALKGRLDLPCSVITIPENQEALKASLDLPFSVIKIPENQEALKGRLDLPFSVIKILKKQSGKVKYPSSYKGALDNGTHLGKEGDIMTGTRWGNFSIASSSSFASSIYC